MLPDKLIPHERKDDTHVYPAIAQLIGGDDPMAAMSRTREIQHLTRLLNRIESHLPLEGPDPATVVELRRVLYGLDAVLRLHPGRRNLSHLD